jgi:hypothetical protein
MRSRVARLSLNARTLATSIFSDARAVDRGTMANCGAKPLTTATRVSSHSWGRFEPTRAGVVVVDAWIPRRDDDEWRAGCCASVARAREARVDDDERGLGG